MRLAWPTSGALPIGLALISLGCVYRLQPIMVPSVQHVRLVAPSSDGYRIKVQEKEYPVDLNGEATIKIPAMRGGCGPYLFDVIKLGRDQNPSNVKIISLIRNGQTVRQLSLSQLWKLRKDLNGNYLIE
jgi:hypothetical protein